MTISIDKIILIALLALGVGAYPIYKGLALAQNRQEVLKPNVTESSSLEQSYKSRFVEERKQILEEIREEFNIPQEKWDKGFIYFDYVCENNQNIFKENCKPTPVSNEFANRIRNLLAKNGINADKVAVEFNAEYGWPVATYQRAHEYDLTCSIDINQEWFGQQPIELQNAIISHEIMHLKHFDVFENNLILGILEANGITAEQYKNSKSLQKYHHMRELRADLMAGLQDIEVAKALHNDFCNCVEAQLTNDLSEHPSNQTRMQQMASLIKNLEAEETIKLA